MLSYIKKIKRSCIGFSTENRNLLLRYAKKKTSGRMKILLLAGNTLRSRAYAQRLSFRSDVEICGLFYGFDQKFCESPKLNKETERFLKQRMLFLPDFSITLSQTFKSNNWEYFQIESNDVNSGSIMKEIRSLKADLIIYSGYGGQILKKEHFMSKIPYLHMHPGFLPEEKGSTTIYYSILNDRECFVSAFFMNSEIDEGGIVIRKEYEVPQNGVDIDKWYDNCIRADCLDAALNKILKNDYELIYPDYKKSDNFYIIHPVLKHLAILSLSV